MWGFNFQFFNNITRPHHVWRRRIRKTTTSSRVSCVLIQTRFYSIIRFWDWIEVSKSFDPTRFVYWRILPLYQSMLKELTSFFSSLLFSELCCRVPCNWKYINLFLIGSWTTTSWGIYHQAFSATIPSWSGCKFGVFFNIGVRGTHGIQSRHLSAWVISHIQYAKKRFK